MPWYEYWCHVCGGVFEDWQPLSEPLPPSAQCGGCGLYSEKRLIGNPQVIYQGGREDFKSGKAKHWSRRTKEALIAKHGRKGFMERFDVDRDDPDATPRPGRPSKGVPMEVVADSVDRVLKGASTIAEAEAREAV